jgi:hypothetical protein
MKSRLFVATLVAACISTGATAFDPKDASYFCTAEISAGLTPISKKAMAMTDTTIICQEEENLLSYDVSDEAIEAAAKDVFAGSYTQGYPCTGLSVCPG